MGYLVRLSEDRISRLPRGYVAWCSDGLLRLERIAAGYKSFAAVDNATACLSYQEFDRVCGTLCQTCGMACSAACVRLPVR